MNIPFALPLVAFASFYLISCSRESNRAPAESNPLPSFSIWECPDSETTSLSLVSKPSLRSSPKWMADHISKRRNSELVLRALKVTPTERVNQLVFGYERQGIPFCREFGRIDEINGQRFIQDNSKALDALSIGSTVWADREESLAASLRQLGIEGKGQLIEGKRCWWDEQGQALPAWEIVAATDEGEISAFANGEKVYAAAPRRFGVDALARIYEKDSSGPLIDVPLSGLDDSGFLRSSNFVMMTPEGRIQPQSQDGVFAAELDDSRFGEISLFANLEKMSEWFGQFKPKKNPGCDPVEIHPVIPGELNNNGYYQQASLISVPGIYMASGDGVGLQNLHTDSDPVSHELGHHYVYRALTEITDWTSVTIHEGLADFFVFARSGDPCLGETICPAASKICAVRGRCLRSADNELKLGGPGLPKEPHLRSQVLSGMLWDLGQVIGLDEMAKITFTAIDYLLPRSDFPTLIKALMLADFELNGGRNSCAIFEEALKRELIGSPSNLNCANYVKTN